MMMESGGGLFEDIEHEEMRCATGGKGPPPASVLESPPRSTRSKCGKEIPPVLDPVPILDWQKPLGRCEGAEWTRDDERRLRDLVVFSQSMDRVEYPRSATHTNCTTLTRVGRIANLVKLHSTLSRGGGGDVTGGEGYAGIPTAAPRGVR
eukprot:Hpha_TRINITY_DN12026_c0_g1::TRINITY_DN12026_c0_g1_i1::g.141106::m.141106